MPNIFKSIRRTKPQPPSTEDLTARLLAQTDQMLASSAL